jgi:hypothetical protein
MAKNLHMLYGLLRPHGGRGVILHAQPCYIGFEHSQGTAPLNIPMMRNATDNR